QDRCAGPLPAWGAAGAEIVTDISGHERLKLHVLNGTHSALAYLGLPRGHPYVRQAIADTGLRAFLEEMVAREIAPALAPLDAAAYWRTVLARFENPMIDHRLAQIAEVGWLAKVIAAWLDLMATRPSRDPANDWFATWAKTGADKAAALDNPTLFP